MLMMLMTRMCSHNSSSPYFLRGFLVRRSYGVLMQTCVMRRRRRRMFGHNSSFPYLLWGFFVRRCVT
eukprot:12201845-Ditylum_brightwellii.AAC.1